MMLRSHSLDSLLRFVETYGSSSVASTIRKYAGKIADIVDKLLTWADVLLKAIEDQITGGLNGIGVPSVSRSSRYLHKNFSRFETSPLKNISFKAAALTSTPQVVRQTH
ncbi:hypothetical protein, partial [Desulfofundulus thermobenzoicus]|uniref:hypothetical protein n=1 Tax=Desulfofundulus thermobenzoicus TaxID=29376 RepID=UPI001A9AC8C5